MISFEKNEQNDKEKLLSIKANSSNYEIHTNSYKLDKTDNICTKNNPWFILKLSRMENKLGKYKISQGDIIKIGRITTRIKDIVFNNNNDKKKNVIDENIKLEEISTFEQSHGVHIARTSESQTIKNCLKRKNSKKKIHKKICRICYMEEDDEENPLLQPCICSGSMKYIHLNCLKHWIITKNFEKIENNDICKIFLVKPIECELCKTKFPDFVRHNEKLFSLIDYKIEFKNYLTLESLASDKYKNKFLYIISLDKQNKIKIGRGHDSDVILTDISVSRIHSILTIDNKNIFLEDNNSKFGTLILCQTPNIKLIENLPLYFQVGRTFFNFWVKKAPKFFNCCGVSERPNLYFYHRQNQSKIVKYKLLTVKTENCNDDNSDSGDEIEEENESYISEGNKNQRQKVLVLNNNKGLINDKNKNETEQNNNNNTTIKKLNKDIGIRGTMLYDENDLENDDEENNNNMNINQQNQEQEAIKEDINEEDDNIEIINSEKEDEKESKKYKMATFEKKSDKNSLVNNQSFDSKCECDVQSNKSDSELNE